MCEIHVAGRCLTMKGAGCANDWRSINLEGNRPQTSEKFEVEETGERGDMGTNDREPTIMAAFRFFLFLTSNFTHPTS